MRVREIACSVASSDFGIMAEWVVSQRGRRALAGIGIAGINSLAAVAAPGVTSWLSIKAGLWVAARESRGLLEYFGERLRRR